MMLKFLDSDRLLAEVSLEPIQGSRFQPTGFPSLGPAEFVSMSDDGQNIDCLLVESQQSMANRLESICWDVSKSKLIDTLEGMPLITVNNEDGSFLTNSILEAHRMNSSYMLEGDDKTLNNIIKTELSLTEKEGSVKISNLARFAFKCDPNSILHGLFLSKKEIAGGRYKMTRSLSSFIEAENVKPIVSGGVKLDHVDPKGGEAGAESGFGHIPYSRTEYSAESIKAYFNIDLALIESYGLGTTANEFLLTFALWKIQRFLKQGLRLRTACDLKIKTSLKVTYPETITIPNLDSLDNDLKLLIKKCKSEDLFGESLVIQYKKSKKDKKTQDEKND